MLRSPLLSVLLVSAATACGGHEARSEARDRPGRVDAAVELAARLPRGAEGCSVGRPGALSPGRRDLFSAVSHASALVWQPGAPFSAYAMADRARSDGTRATVVLVRISTDAHTAREWLARNARLHIPFAENEEEPFGEGFRATLEDPRTLRITRGVWPTVRAPGMERRCLELALSSRDAIEVSSRRGRVVMLGTYAELARARDVIMVDDGRAIHITHRILVDELARASGMIDEPELDLLDGDLAELASPSLFEVVGDVQEGPLRVTELRLLWEDLGLLRDDVRAIRVAEARQAREDEPRDVTTVEVDNLAVVEHQRTLWMRKMEQSASADERMRHAASLRVLLARAIPLHPTEAALRRSLFEVLARDLVVARDAIEVADAALAAGVGDAESWHQLRREGFARASAEDLAAVLVEDRIVDASVSERAARDLERLVADGADYGFAEGSWIAADALLRRVASQRGRIARVAPATLPLDSLPEAISALVESREIQGALYVAVAGHVRPWGLVRWDAAHSPVVDLVRADRTYLVGVASLGATEMLRALGTTLSDHVATGELAISFFVVPLGASPNDPVTWGHIEGSIDDDRMHIERAVGPASRVDWDRVRRYLGDPLARAAERVFPPPDVSIDAASEQDARALLAAGDAELGLGCEQRGELTVVCTAAGDRTDSLRHALVRFAAERMAADAARLFTR